MLKKLVKVNISVPVRQMYNLEKSELFFSVESYSCLLDFSLTGGWLKSGGLLHLRGSLMDLVYWASHSSQCLPDTGHVQENRLVTY